MTPFVFSHLVFALAAIVGLVLIVMARYERRAGATAAYDWLVAAQVAFVFVAVPIEQMGYDFDAATNPYWMRISALGLVLFPGLLARSICALCSRSGWMLRLSDATTIALTIALLSVPTFPGLNYPELPTTVIVVVVGLVLEMLLATAVSIHALVHASQGQAAIVRRRASLLICAQAIFSVTFLGWLAAPGELASLIANWVLVAVGAILIAALVWPRRLLQAFATTPRDQWQAFGVLMASTDVRRDLVGIVEQLTESWGLVGAAVLDADGSVIESCGDTALDAVPHRRDSEQRFGSGRVSIVTWSTPLSLPLTGSDQHYVELLAMMIQFALEREAELAHRSAIAAAEVAAAQSLAEANQRLVEADAMKSRFVSTASHELRTPLTSIIGLARTCSERWDELDHAQLREFQDIIVEQGERLERIVDNLLTTSRIDAQMIGGARECVELAPVIDVAVAGAGIARSDIAVELADDATCVLGDEQAIYEILINLLSNAAKYGAAPYRVRASRCPATEGVVELVVEDAGEGVDASVQDRVFERFARGVHLTQPGTGLGLSIVQDLAQSLDGDVGYRALERGSAFWVRLPDAVK